MSISITAGQARNRAQKILVGLAAQLGKPLALWDGQFSRVGVEDHGDVRTVAWNSVAYLESGSIFDQRPRCSIAAPRLQRSGLSRREHIRRLQRRFIVAMIVYGARRYVSDRIVVYSFSPTPDDADVEGVVIADPADLNGMKIFPLDASRHGGEAVLMKAYRHFTSTNEWPEEVSHIS